jgi:hypothetical protein
MVEITPDVVADELRVQLSAVPEEVRKSLVEAISQLTLRHTSEERKRCRRLCERRVQLWRNVKASGTPLAGEARFRANEAQYIADLIVGTLGSDQETA